MSQESSDDISRQIDQLLQQAQHDSKQEQAAMLKKQMFDLRNQLLRERMQAIEQGIDPTLAKSVPPVSNKTAMTTTIAKPTTTLSSSSSSAAAPSVTITSSSSTPPPAVSTEARQQQQLEANARAAALASVRASSSQQHVKPSPPPPPSAPVAASSSMHVDAATPLAGPSRSLLPTATALPATSANLPSNPALVMTTVTPSPSTSPNKIKNSTSKSQPASNVTTIVPTTIPTNTTTTTDSSSLIQTFKQITEQIALVSSIPQKKLKTLIELCNSGLDSAVTLHQRLQQQQQQQQQQSSTMNSLATRNQRKQELQKDLSDCIKSQLEQFCSPLFDNVLKLVQNVDNKLDVQIDQTRQTLNRIVEFENKLNQTLMSKDYLDKLTHVEQQLDRIVSFENKLDRIKDKVDQLYETHNKVDRIVAWENKIDQLLNRLDVIDERTSVQQDLIESLWRQTTQVNVDEEEEDDDEEYDETDDDEDEEHEEEQDLPTSQSPHSNIVSQDDPVISHPTLLEATTSLTQPKLTTDESNEIDSTLSPTASTDRINHSRANSTGRRIRILKPGSSFTRSSTDQQEQELKTCAQDQVDDTEQDMHIDSGSTSEAGTPPLPPQLSNDDPDQRNDVVVRSKSRSTSPGTPPLPSVERQNLESNRSMVVEEPVVKSRTAFPTQSTSSTLLTATSTNQEQQPLRDQFKSTFSLIPRSQQGSDTTSTDQTSSSLSSSLVTTNANVSRAQSSNRALDDVSSTRSSDPTYNDRRSTDDHRESNVERDFHVNTSNQTSSQDLPANRSQRRSNSIEQIREREVSNGNGSLKSRQNLPTNVVVTRHDHYASSNNDRFAYNNDDRFASHSNQYQRQGNVGSMQRSTSYNDSRYDDTRFANQNSTRDRRSINESLTKGSSSSSPSRDQSSTLRNRFTDQTKVLSINGGSTSTNVIVEDRHVGDHRHATTSNVNTSSLKDRFKSPSPHSNQGNPSRDVSDEGDEDDDDEGLTMTISTPMGTHHKPVLLDRFGNTSSSSKKQNSNNNNTDKLLNRLDGKNFTSHSSDETNKNNTIKSNSLLNRFESNQHSQQHQQPTDSKKRSSSTTTNQDDFRKNKRVALDKNGSGDVPLLERFR
ncbi:hypothetical protein OIO90_005293 [Microbotryomycetes sp. JL221]|nr:hypothetical protein OIO90_005293 [Microbotryomycetes sp. JL221]